MVVWGLFRSHQSGIEKSVSERITQLCISPKKDQYHSKQEHFEAQDFNVLVEQLFLGIPWTTI